MQLANTVAPADGVPVQCVMAGLREFPERSPLSCFLHNLPRLEALGCSSRPTGQDS